MADREEITGLLTLIDRLERLLQRSGLAELEVEQGATTVVLRTAAAFALPPTPAPAAVSDFVVNLPAADVEAPRERGSHAISAPLTGVFYRSPSPGAEPYVREGGQVNAGQVIGLIEAMKLFNEIKSDATGTVRHVAVGDGDLVKARQTLIEVDPA